MPSLRIVKSTVLSCPSIHSAALTRASSAVARQPGQLDLQDMSYSLRLDEDEVDEGQGEKYLMPSGVRLWKWPNPLPFCSTTTHPAVTIAVNVWRFAEVLPPTAVSMALWRTYAHRWRVPVEQSVELPMAARTGWCRSCQRVTEVPLVARHAFASSLISAGVSVKAVADAMGHENATVTLRTYASLWPGDDDRIRDALEDVWKIADLLRTKSAQFGS